MNAYSRLGSSSRRLLKGAYLCSLALLLSFISFEVLDLDGSNVRGEWTVGNRIGGLSIPPLQDSSSPLFEIPDRLADYFRYWASFLQKRLNSDPVIPSESQTPPPESRIWGAFVPLLFFSSLHHEPIFLLPRALLP